MLEPMPGVIRSILGSTRSIRAVSDAEKVVEVTVELVSAYCRWSEGKADHGDRSMVRLLSSGTEYVRLTAQSLCLEILYGALGSQGGPLSNDLISVWFLDRFPQFAPLRDGPIARPAVPRPLLDAAVST